MSVVLPRPAEKLHHVCWGHCCTASNLCAPLSPTQLDEAQSVTRTFARAAPATQPRRRPNAVGWMACLASSSAQPLAATVAGWPKRSAKTNLPEAHRSDSGQAPVASTGSPLRQRLARVS
jgi:hypothetical protein